MATWPLPLQYTRATTYANHNARDLPCPIGTPVFAPLAGTVSHSDQGGGGGGKIVWVNNTSIGNIGLMHLSQQLRNGETVAEGTQVGVSGNTGHSTGPHLHIQVGYPANESLVVQLLSAAGGKANLQNATNTGAGAAPSGQSSVVNEELKKAVLARNEKGDSFYLGGTGNKEYKTVSDVPGPKENKKFLNAEYASRIPMINGTLRKGWIEGGVVKSKLNFQFNPSEIQMEYIFNDGALTSTEMTNFEQGLPNVLEGATFQLNLLFDRSMEVNADRRRIDSYDAIPIIGAATSRAMATPGVLEDIYILDRLIGVADGGIPYTQPVKVYLSPLFMFHGWLTGASVQYVKFDHRMNPMVATVQVAIRAVFSAPQSEVKAAAAAQAAQNDPNNTAASAAGLINNTATSALQAANNKAGVPILGGLPGFTK